MMARAGAAIGAEERAGLHLRIQHLIAVRMSVAIRPPPRPGQGSARRAQPWRCA
jgi:hypothetical protein